MESWLTPQVEGSPSFSSRSASSRAEMLSVGKQRMPGKQGILKSSSGKLQSRIPRSGNLTSFQVISAMEEPKPILREEIISVSMVATQNPTCIFVFQPYTAGCIALSWSIDERRWGFCRIG